MMAALKVHGQPTAFVTSKRTSAVAWTNPAAPGRPLPTARSSSARRRRESLSRSRQGRRSTGRPIRTPCDRIRGGGSSPSVAPDDVSRAVEARSAAAGNPCSSERVHVVVVRARGRDVGEQVDACATEAATQATRTMTPMPTMARRRAERVARGMGGLPPGRFESRTGLVTGRPASSEPTARTLSPRLPRP